MPGTPPRRGNQLTDSPAQPILPDSTEPSPLGPLTPPTCLNCAAALDGAFCSQCGQRAIPPYPAMRDLVGDAWQELSGYDGRFMRTLRQLFRHPGSLTLEVLEGRRARYVSPVRLYLAASLFYFLVAAASPDLGQAPAPVVPGSDIKIDLRNPAAAQLSPERREEALQRIDRAPWLIRAVLRPAVLNPAGFRARIVENVPRMLFALVPVFAAIVSLFYRRRPFSQHLIFALHLHAAAFIVQAIREPANFIGSRVVLGPAQAIAFLFIAGYGVLAFRQVYGGKWRWILVKAAGILALYVIAGLLGLLVIVTWASYA